MLRDCGFVVMYEEARFRFVMVGMVYWLVKSSSCICKVMSGEHMQVENFTGLTFLRWMGSGPRQLAVSPERHPPNVTDKPQANKFANKLNTTSSEHGNKPS